MECEIRDDDGLQIVLAKAIWNGLSKIQQLEMLIRQAEWIVFQGSLLGVVADQRSLKVMAMARRALMHEEEDIVTGDSIDNAFGAFYGYGGYDVKDDVRSTITAWTVAYVCYNIGLDTRRIESDFLDDDFLQIANYYLKTIKGNQWQASPLAKWLKNSGIRDVDRIINGTVDYHLG